jgi:hypothetical protein
MLVFESEYLSLGTNYSPLCININTRSNFLFYFHLCLRKRESEQNLVKRKGNEITWLSFQLEESRKEGGKIMVVCGW